MNEAEGFLERTPLGFDESTGQKDCTLHLTHVNFCPVPESEIPAVAG